MNEGENNFHYKLKLFHSNSLRPFSLTQTSQHSKGLESKHNRPDGIDMDGASYT